MDKRESTRTKGSILRKPAHNKLGELTDDTTVVEEEVEPKDNRAIELARRSRHALARRRSKNKMAKASRKLNR